MTFLVLKILRWMFGYVSFEVKGGYPEKFINFSVKEKINLWDLKKIGGVLRGNVVASEYKFLRAFTKKSESRISVKKKKGFPFIRFKYRKRIGIIIGVMVFGFILSFFSLYIWSVKVIGNQSIPTVEIVKTMEELGVAPGSLKSRIEPSLIEHLAMKKLGSAAWMSINISGSCVNVSVKEKVSTPEIVSKGEPCNVIASQDGQIERLETYSGIPVVNVGDVVTKGQLLVSGIMESADSKSVFLDASCKVFAKTKRKIVERIKLSTLKAIDTGKIINRYRIKTFGLEIPLGWGESPGDNFRCEMSSRSLKFFGVEIPIRVYRERWYEQEFAEVNFVPEEAHAEIEKIMSTHEKEDMNNAQILKKFDEDREENGEYVLERKFICVEDIGKREKIFIE